MSWSDELNGFGRVFGLTGKHSQSTIPNIPNLKTEKSVRLYLLGLLRGLLIIGKPGVGKTRLLAWIIVDMMRKTPELAILVLDASGALRKDIVGHILTLPVKEQTLLFNRLNIDIPFHPEYVQPMPEFHKDYGISFESQIQRVATNMRTLNKDTMDMGFMGKPMLEECVPELGRMTCALENEHGETYQITEWRRLLNDKQQLSRAVALTALRAPSAKWYFEQALNSAKMSFEEWEKRTYALKSILGVFEAREMRARMGFYKPAITMNEIEGKGLCHIVSAERMLGHELEMRYVFTQIYSMFKMHINQRTPDDTNNTPFMIVFEEAPILWEIPGMGEETFNLATFYRSRFVLPIIDIQGTWQTGITDPVMRRKIWNIGNIILMGIDSVDDGWEAMHNLGNFGPSAGLQAEATPNRFFPTPEHTQYTMAANWVQLFKQRECVIKRYHNQAVMDDFITYIPKIQNIPVTPNNDSINAKTDEIFKKRAVKIREALDEINKRELGEPPKPPKPDQGTKIEP